MELTGQIDYCMGCEPDMIQTDKQSLALVPYIQFYMLQKERSFSCSPCPCYTYEPEIPIDFFIEIAYEICLRSSYQLLINTD